MGLWSTVWGADHVRSPLFTDLRSIPSIELLRNHIVTPAFVCQVQNYPLAISSDDALKNLQLGISEQGILPRLG